jgi:dTDP-4-dehydrorhamnose reductase
MYDDKPLTVLQFGETGQVSRELIRAGSGENYHIRVLGRKDADFLNPESAADFVRQAVSCDAVVNVAAYTAVDRAESDEPSAMMVNAEAVGHLARACAIRSVPLIHLSTDYVFDGRSASPYQETDPTNPINVYGRSKLAGENFVREFLPQHVILRTSWVYSSYGTNFLKTMLRLGIEKDELRVVNDQLGSPTAAGDIAAAIHTVLRLVFAAPSSDLFGTFHYTGMGCTSWYDFAAAILDYGRNFYPIKAKLQAIETAQYPTPAARPRYSRLDCGKLESVYHVHSVAWEDSMRDAITRLAENGGKP